VQVGLYELNAIESETTRRRRAEQKGGACQLGADYYSIRAR
jgi:hypothetical protein